MRDTIDRAASRAARHAARAAGFTLIELLLATVMGAVLLVSAASMAGNMSENVATLQEAAASQHERALARMVSDLRYASWVRVPAADRLEMADYQGRESQYLLRDGEVIAVDPGGSEGALCDGVAGLAFTPLTTRRLREGAPTTTSGDLYGSRTPTGSAVAVELSEGSSMALAFTIDSDAGNTGDVGEKVLGATPTALHLPVAAPGVVGVLIGEIFPARAPGDPRPRPGASSKGSMTIAIAALPAAPLKAVAVLPRGVTPPPIAGTTLFGVIDVSGTHDPPTSHAPLAALGRFDELQAGVAYTLVLTVANPGGVSVLTSHPTGGATPGNAAFRKSPGDPLVRHELAVPFRVSGERTVTTTDESQAVSVVRCSLTTSGGQALARSAVVYAQALAADPWMGMLPGEPPPSP